MQMRDLEVSRIDTVCLTELGGMGRRALAPERCCLRTIPGKELVKVQVNPSPFFFFVLLAAHFLCYCMCVCSAVCHFRVRVCI